MPHAKNTTQMAVEAQLFGFPHLRTSAQGGGVTAHTDLGVSKSPPHDPNPSDCVA